MSKYVTHELFVCDCDDISHQFILNTWDFGDGSPSLEANIKLNIYRPWYQRILIAIKYIFKFNSENQFDNIILTKDVNKLQKALENFVELNKKALIEDYKF